LKFGVMSPSVCSNSRLELNFLYTLMPNDASTCLYIHIQETGTIFSWYTYPISTSLFCS
jgi:hypothetical protein